MSEQDSSVPRFTPPPIGTPFNERRALSQMLASACERFKEADGKVETIEPQKYVPRLAQVRAGVGSNLGALDQFLLGGE